MHVAHVFNNTLAFFGAVPSPFVYIMYSLKSNNVLTIVFRKTATKSNRQSICEVYDTCPQKEK